jgi:BRCA1-associated protein
MFRLQINNDASLEASKGPDNQLDQITFSTGRLQIEYLTGTLKLFRERGGSSVQEQRSNVVCVLAVPRNMNVSMFCDFIHEKIASIEHIRVLREPIRVNKYMVLMKFSNQDKAMEFCQTFNGKEYKSPSFSFDSTCHAVFVRQVEVSSGSDARVFESDPCFSSLSSPLVADGASDELPTCVVCLERLDSSVSGLATTLCSHTFHCTCLSRWNDDSCPVCRYCLADEDDVGAGDEQALNACESCGMREGLWACLICGFSGCSRNANQHSLKHYESTGHSFALELSSSRIWSYKCDAYVHRILKGNTSSKILVLPDRNKATVPAEPSPTSSPRGIKSMVVLGDATKLHTDAAGKLKPVEEESLEVEYALILSSVLEAQRSHFEGLISQLYSLLPSEEEEASEDHSWRRELADRILFGDENHKFSLQYQHALPPVAATLSDESTGGSKDASIAASREWQVRYNGLISRTELAERKWASESREKRALTRKLEETKELVAGLMEENSFLSDVNDMLRANQASFEDRAKKDEAKIAELEEQTRDLMTALDHQEIIRTTPSLKQSIDDGDVSVRIVPAKSKKSKQKPKSALSADDDDAIPSLLHKKR